MAEQKEPKRWITVNGKHIPIYEGESNGDALDRAFGRKDDKDKSVKENKTKKEVDLLDKNLSDTELREAVKEQFIDKDSYIYSKEYKDAQDIVSSVLKEKENLEVHKKELEKTIEEGIIVDPEDVKNLGRSMAKVLGKKTPEAKAAEEELRQVRADLSSVERKLENKRNALRDTIPMEDLRQEWKASKWTMKEATKDKYEGFELDTHTPKYEEARERGETVLMEMSPQEYLKRCAYDIFWERYDGSTYEKQIFTAGIADARHTQNLANMMKDGTDMYLPVLDYDDKEQEGRHRAVAAMMLGIDTMPVLVRLPKHRR